MSVHVLTRVDASTEVSFASFARMAILHPRETPQRRGAPAGGVDCVSDASFQLLEGASA